VPFQNLGKTPVSYQRNSRCNAAMPSLIVSIATNCRNRWSTYILTEEEGMMFKLGRVCKDIIQGKKIKEKKNEKNPTQNS